ncbi:flap endonuclease GEN homolog 1 isoform X2 [Kryptolebias marmoratus]|uniref:flap endonuclease GEN homolog 1 isoform X2 n=1 Tax=Kryptolebias marmoratus TaxID=37003 RepID=UPI000D530EEF|nr:flap endonuclease GEN homolog 1 isoform X2 [Kryptolebias marmoratus]
MGVHDLWSIVESVRESVSLFSLSGKTLAVDLSLWVCEAQHVQAMMGRVTKPHLRNLFFRVSSLTLMGVKLVFVMEGEAPKLKSETMSKRAEARYGGFKKASASKSAKSTSRGRFNAVLRECAEMLDYLGVPWVTAAGEAEAMCAYLDSVGLVDGCITNDGDAFLYGARTVYRNFNMNSKVFFFIQDPQVDCYQTFRVQTELHLSRENLVGLAILLGCDYIPKGIPGVGKEQALRLIETLKGQSLLERFKQWKTANTDVLDGVVKKVSHCNICRHPGSAKAHERGGCEFCGSQRFCQPRAFDSPCPCDWHCHERTRQASALEANIRRKTMVNQQFPFTEIISEFLVPRDKPVSHFKRRQPNMLLMQKFACDKMEWKKHYTSEKVLVLMTYTELMNKKCRQDVPSQIKPIRILKPRVRNAIACFEIIWSVPEHYVFPEDRPTADRHEVKTVEEESLFRAAFPEVVESYLRSKALAVEDKTKKKRAKTKKEKPCDPSDGVLDLLGRLTLQSSSAQTQTLLPSSSNTEKAEVIVLDTPPSHKQLREESKVCTRLSRPLSPAESEVAASPSVSAVIDALHLSDIDWDAPSFASSPSSQAAEPKQANTADREETHGGIEEREPASDVKQADSGSAAELCYTECPLRDRVLMRSTAMNQTKKGSDVVPKQLNCELALPGHISEGKHSGGNSSKRSTDGNVLVKEPVADKKQTHALKEQQTPLLQTHNRMKEKSNEKPPRSYKFVRAALSSSSAPPRRCHSDPDQSDSRSTSVPQSTKRSVCTGVCSSSEDSDTENQPSAPQRQTKTNKIRRAFVSDLPSKPVSNQSETIKPNPKTSHRLQRTGPVSQSHGEKVGDDSPVSAENKRQDVCDEVFLQTPASPVALFDCYGSVICSDSPLPLAERLRLKFLK